MGYRAGIHMKSYMDRQTLIVIGGRAGSFLGEYQAGGTILVLNSDNLSDCVGNFCGTGMYGGRIFLRQDTPPVLPPQVSVHEADADEINEICEYIREFCGYFGDEYMKFAESRFLVLTPNKSNPYQQMYASI